ncbi:hypothetical protein [Cellulosimicrobium sp. Marseille-Q4280]|uniref:hypothetical protein n=1 Tax=Cellulosimicrobium sp. Marseille-Q4280 TaxID=2937992 RepID=UPI00203FEC3C|nr:hypothetical protein [Cellulosimicrobium sp. Marseille-Q4280]
MSRPTGNTPFPQRARSLAPRQYGQPVTQAPEPIPVKAWVVTVAGDDLEVAGDATAWTSRAVRVRFVDKFGHLDSAWLWAGAVSRR